MTKTFEFKDLPKGMGSCLGAFVRTSWMLLHKRYTIIGFNLNDLNPLECIPETTTLVTDVTLKLATTPYRIEESSLVESAQVRKSSVDDMPIYEITIFKQTDSLSTADLAPYVSFEQPEVFVKTLYPMEFNLKLYIKPSVSYVTEEVNKSYLNESPFDCSKTVAMASNNRTSAKVYFNLEDFEVTENLTIIFEGDEAYYNAFVDVVKSLTPEYLSKIG